MSRLLTDDNLRAIFPNALGGYIDALLRSERLLDSAGILANARRLAYFLGQAGAETGGLTITAESGVYSAARLRQVFPKYFTPAQARVYAGRPVAILSRAYANRLGNGSEASRDGWTYRGRGLLQITGRDAYRRRGAQNGLDLERQPDLAAEPVHGIKLAVQYWSDLDLNRWADADDLLAVSRGVNGGNPRRRIQPNGMEHRKHWTAKAARVLAAPAHVPDPAADGLLVEGEEGEIVRLMQARLIELGYGHILGRADGVFGPNTRAAVLAFQSDRGFLPADAPGKWIVARYDEAAKEAEPAQNESRTGISVPELRERKHPTIGFFDTIRRVAAWVFGGTVTAGAVAEPDSLAGAVGQIKGQHDALAPLVQFAAANWWWVLPAAAMLIIYGLSVRAQAREAADYAAMKSTQGE